MSLLLPDALPPLLPAAAPGGLVVADTFPRADSALTLGSAETGQPWSVPVGAVGVLSGRAYIAAGINSVAAFVQTGIADGEVTADLTWRTGNECAVFARCDSLSSANNCIEAILRNTGITLRKRVAAALTNIGSYAFAAVDAQVYRVAVQMQGPAIQVAVDGVYRISVTETDHVGNTVAGFWGFKSAAIAEVQFDNFRVWR